MTIRSCNTIFTGAVLTACLAFSSAGAFEPSTDAEKKLVEWLEANSCAMTQDEFMDKAMSGAGVSGSDLMTARRGMTKSGVIRKGEGNSMTLTAGAACGGVEVAEPAFDSGSEKDAQVQKLIAVFEDNGCVLSQRKAGELALASGMTDEQIDIAGEALEDSGGFSESDAGLQLNLGKCKNFKAEAPEGDDRSRVMAMFEQNDCSLMEDQLPDVAQQFQITRKQFKAVTRPMKEEGAFSEDNNKITLLVGDICGTGDVAKETVVESKADMTVDEKIASIFVAGNCSMDGDLYESEAKRLGYDRDALKARVKEMMDAGEITYNEDTNKASLLTGPCENHETVVETPSAPTDDKRSKLVALFEQNGCRMNEEQAMKLFPAIGMDLENDDDLQLIDRMFEAGDIIEGSGDEAILVIGEICSKGAAAGGASDLNTAIMSAFSENDCALTEDEFSAAMEAAGVDVDAAGELVEAMIDSGKAVYDRDTKRAKLLSGACEK